jgi:beta-glucoside operon transcriptional antiterminator
MERMMQEIPEAYWGLSGIIVDYISENLNLQGSIGFVVSLVDHIYMSVKRFEKGIDIPEVFSAETKYLYPEEYKVAEHIVEIVNEYLNVKLNENEAGYIALHIIDARTEQGAMGSTFATELIRKVLEIVMGKYGEVIDTSAESYNRFLTHLKYFANRIMERQEETDRNKYGVIFDALSKDCPEQHNCVLEIREMLKREYRYLISSEEQLNLLIHVIKLTEK